MHIIEIAIPIIVIIALVAIVGFFASSETAFLSIQRVTVRQLLKEKPVSPSAIKIAWLKDNMDRLLTLVLVGINFTTTLASSLATAFATKIAGASGATYATVVMSFVLIIFGEILPKTIATNKTVLVAKWEAPLLIFLQKLLFPIVWFFSKISSSITAFFQKILKTNRHIITEEELKTLIDVGSKEGTLEQNERKMLHKIFAFSDLHVHNVLRHRSLVKSISEEASYKELVQLFAETGYSYIPVYKDDTEHITGVVRYKWVLYGKSSKNATVKQYMRSVLFVPESLTVIELLQKFKKERRSFAVALTEHGALAGIVSIDDVMRAVMGRVNSDYSTTILSPEERIQILSQNEFIVPGDMRIEDVNSSLNLNLASENYYTLGGWLLEKFDCLPSIGEMIKHNGTLFIIEDQAQHRIQTVRIRLGV